MALDLGELSGQVAFDVSPMQNALRAARRDIAEFSRSAWDPMGPAARAAAQDASRQVDAGLGGAAASAEQHGEETGDRFGRGLSKAKAGVVAAAAALGAAGAAGVMEAMDRELTTDRLTAALGDPAKAKRNARVVARIYGDAYGESFEEVAESVEAVATTVQDIDPGQGRGLKGLTEQAYTLSDALGTDLPRNVQVAQQLVTGDFADNVTDAFDLILAGSRKVPLALREDLTDAVDEYAPFFSQLGYSGEEMFTLLANGSEKGMYGIDKTGDAIAEFAKLVTGDMARTQPIIEGLGLDYGDMAADLTAGGDRGVKATNKIVDGLLGLKDEGRLTRDSLALFGTPLEDLSTKDIPKFLESLRLGEEGLGDWEGATKRASDTMGDNASTNITMFKRRVQTELVDFIGGQVLPALGDWTSAMADDVGPMAESMGELWERVGPVVGDVIGWLANDVFPKMADATGTVYDALSDFWDEISTIADEHPELADGIKGLVDGFGWLIENVFPAVAWWVETTLPAMADGIGWAADRAEDVVLALTYVAEYGSQTAIVLLDAFGWAFEGILNFANTSFGWIFDLLNMDNPIQTALDGFRVFRDGATEDLKGVSNVAVAMREVIEEKTGVNIETSAAEERLNALLDKAAGLKAALNPTGGVGALGGDGRPTPESPLDLYAGPSMPQSPGPRGRRPGGNRQPASPDLNMLDDGMGANPRVAPSSSRGSGNTHITNNIQAHNYNDFQDQLDRDMDRRRSETSGGAGVRRAA